MEIEGNTTTDVVDVISDAVETALEAEQRAEETAEAIALAAIETERGRRVSDLEERMNQCQSTLESLPVMLAQTMSAEVERAAATIQANLSAEMNSLLSVAVAGLANQNSPLSSTPPVSEVEPLPVQVVEVTEAEPPTPEPAPAVPEQEKKKRHRFL